MRNAPLFPQASDPFSRRHFLRTIGLGAALFATRGLFAEELIRETAWVEEAGSVSRPSGTAHSPYDQGEGT